MSMVPSWFRSRRSLGPSAGVLRAVRIWFRSFWEIVPLWSRSPDWYWASVGEAGNWVPVPDRSRGQACAGMTRTGLRLSTGFLWESGSLALAVNECFIDRVWVVGGLGPLLRGDDKMWV